MSSAANPPSPPSAPPPYQRQYQRQQGRRGRRRDNMSGYDNTQDIIKQLSDIFGPQFKEIKEQLHDLVTRREHDKDLADVSADIAAQRRDFDRLQQWADVRPRKSADADWVTRIETDVRSLETRIAGQPAEAREWFSAFTQGGGCLYMVIALVVVIVFNLITIGVSVGLALTLR